MAKSAKPDRYSSKEDKDELGSLANRLAADLRKHIRSLGNFPILSDPWVEMADVLGRIANISDMESKLPSSKDDATLWETEEQALRFLIEDGKLNLCLRNMIEFKQCQRRQRIEGEGTMITNAEVCDKFEKGLGVVLRNAWLHVEALQTSDLPGLMHHVADVLEGAIEAPAVTEELVRTGDLHQRQEIMVFYYLRGVLRHIEDITEGRVMPFIRERRVFMLAIQLLSIVHTGVLTAHLLVAIETLSLMAETEDFVDHTSQYIMNSSDAEVLVNFKLKCLQPLQTDAEKRRLMRSLVDKIDRAKPFHRKLFVSGAMASQLTENVSDLFDLPQICSLLVRFRLTKVVLQFPDDVLLYSVAVYQCMSEILRSSEDQFSLYIVADSSFGTSVDDVSAMHVSSSVIVYFGSDLSSSGTIPIIIAPPMRKFNLADTIQKLSAASPSAQQQTAAEVVQKNILVLCEATYYHFIATQFMPVISGSITATFTLGRLPPSADLPNWNPNTSNPTSAKRDNNNNNSNSSAEDTASNEQPELIVGGYLVDKSLSELLSSSPSDSNPSVEIWYIGSKREQLTSIFLQFSQHALCHYDPSSTSSSSSSTGVGVLLRGSEQREFRERVGGMMRVERAKVVGLLVGSMGLSEVDGQQILHRLRTLLTAAKKKYYTLVMGRLTVAKLSNFSEIDLYCLISNEDAAVVSAKSFHVPVITPFELELGLGAVEWNSKFLVDSTSVLYHNGNLVEAVERVRTARHDRGEYTDSDEDNDSNGTGREEDVLAFKRDVALIRKAVLGAQSSNSSSSSSSDNSSSGVAGTDVVRRVVPESRISEFVASTSEHFSKLTFKGLVPHVPEGHSTDIHMGQIGIARSYARISADQEETAEEAEEEVGEPEEVGEREAVPEG